MLTPNTTYTMNGVAVNEKIIPDGTVWKDDAKARRTGNRAGDLYKKNQKIKGGPKSVTIHNTGLGGTSDDAELYTRATWPNENMLDARVHYFVDKNGAWQNLKAGTGLCVNDPEGSAEVAWHAGDGSIADGGNMTSLSLEIIMGEGDRGGKAYDNGARIAAWLLWKHNLPIEALVTHTYWCNKMKGKIFSDPDEQCTNLIYGQKWCPTYIFGSTNHATALANWKSFKALVKKYLDALAAPAAPEPVTPVRPLYYVQIGAYKVRANADAQVAKVKSAGYNAILKKAGDLYRVQVGAFSVRANADAYAKKLQAAGFSTCVTTVSGDIVDDTVKVGDVVEFNGSRHYASSFANAAGYPVKPGRAKVTAINEGSAHPYHLIRISGSASNVYGWVDAGAIKKV